MEDLEDTWRFYVQLNFIVTLKRIKEKKNKVKRAKFQFPLASVYMKYYVCKCLVFSCISLSHPVAPYVMDFLFLLVINPYSWIFFLHFCTLAWLFPPHLLLLPLPLERGSSGNFLFFGSQQLTALPQLCSSCKRKGLELTAQSKGGGLLSFRKKGTSLMMHLVLAAA